MDKKTIKEALSAKALINNWQEKALNEGEFLLTSFFTSKRQYDTEISQILGTRRSPVTLSASTLDANTLPLQRGTFELTKLQMPYFKNNLHLSEREARMLFDAYNAKDDGRVKTVIAQIYDDKKYLYDSSVRTVSQMLASIFTTGQIAINNNGVNRVIDYGFTDEQKYEPAVAWTDFEESTPFEDLRTWIDDREEKTGYKIDSVVMNTTTFNLLKKSHSVKANVLLGVNIDPAKVTLNKKQILTYILEELSVRLYLVDERYATDKADANGKPILAKYIPDGVVSFFDGVDTGDIVYSYTPEEISKMIGTSWDSSNKYNMEIMGDGICLTVEDTADIVNTVYKVGMVVLPSLNKAESIGIADVGIL